MRAGWVSDSRADLPEIEKKKKKVLHRSGMCWRWDVVRCWGTVVESTHIFKVLNEGETKLRHQDEASVMLVMVMKAHVCSLWREKSSLLMEPGNGSYCSHHGLLEVHIVSLIKSETYYGATVLFYICSVQWKFNWILFTVRDPCLPGTALENAVVHTY